MCTEIFPHPAIISGSLALRVSGGDFSNRLRHERVRHQSNERSLTFATNLDLLSFLQQNSHPPAVSTVSLKKGCQQNITGQGWNFSLFCATFKGENSLLQPGEGSRALSGLLF
jgi:hypothetical protein